MNKIFNILGLTTLISFSACQDKHPENAENPNFVKLVSYENKFDDYWYQNKAELNSYDLEQARYGEIHRGEAVLVFVTEDFSASKLVKLDDPKSNPNDAIKVLKLNATRNFNTGIYPYSMMASIFTPIDLKKQPNTLKITSTSQDWCGQSFMQVNLDKKNYNISLNSYFESVGDQQYNVEKVMPEDEIWNRIRIEPKSLPVGKIKLLPSTFYTRFRHSEFKPEMAVASMEKDEGNPAMMVYNIQYKNIDRTLKITFQEKFPFQIEGWEETYTSGWGNSAKMLTTKAVRKKSMMLDYWTKNSNDDLVLRKDLELDN